MTIILISNLPLYGSYLLQTKDEPSTSIETDGISLVTSSSAPNSCSSIKTLSQAAAELQATKAPTTLLGGGSNVLSGGGCGVEFVAPGSSAAASSSSLPAAASSADMRTGEEDESNVMQITCKLYLYSSSAASSSASTTWVERGRGFLRLNDIPQAGGVGFKSRLVMRAQVTIR